MQSTLEQDTPMETTSQTVAEPQQPAAPAPAAPQGGSKFKFIILGVVLIGAIIGAYFYFSTLGKISTDDAQVDGHVVMIAPKISGNVTEVLVKDNEHVKAGQVLVVIDPRDYQAKVDQLKAAMNL